jgi:2-polyprenyl-6-methoxyphenol hydroxylase-like FAD-dependent oxidoreductase
MQARPTLDFDAKFFEARLQQPLGLTLGNHSKRTGCVVPENSMPSACRTSPFSPTSSISVATESSLTWAQPKEPGRHGEPTLAEVQALVDQRVPGTIRLHDPYWLSYFHINERKVEDYGRGRVFLAGDAAHIHSPAGGQGMNTGMQDAFNLAWKLALDVHGNATPRLLESYSVERSAVGAASCAMPAR